MKHILLSFMVIGMSQALWFSSATTISPELETTEVVDRLIEFTDRHPIITPHNLLETLITRKHHLPSESPTLPVLEWIIEILITHYYTPTDISPIVSSPPVSSLHLNSFENYTGLTSYMVMDAETITSVTTTQENSLRHQQIRLLITHIFPSRYLRNITWYHVYTDYNSSEVAALYGADQGTWRRDIVINTASLFPDGTLVISSIFHLLHELWHLITLDRNQFSADTQTACTTYRIEEGCLTADSYLYQFIVEFRGTGDHVITDKNTETNFVSDYATINPVEDIAESFAVYVMESPPATETTADKKVRFFLQFDHFALLKSQILKVLSTKETNSTSPSFPTSGNTYSSSWS